MGQKEAGLNCSAPQWHRRVYSDRRSWRGLALHTHKVNSTKGRSRKHGNCGIWDGRCVFPALMPVWTERRLRDKLSGNCGAWSSIGCQWTHPVPAPSSVLAFPSQLPSPSVLNKGASEQESQKRKHDWLQALITGLLSHWREAGGSGRAWPYRWLRMRST